MSQISDSGTRSFQAKLSCFLVAGPGCKGLSAHQMSWPITWLAKLTHVSLHSITLRPAKTVKILNGKYNADEFTFRREMARGLVGFMVLLLLLSICEAASFYQPISDSHRSAALELFSPDHGSFNSLEETYEALRTFDILGIEKKPNVITAACHLISNAVGSSSSTTKELFYALKANNIAKCKINDKAFQGILTRLNAAVNDASSLLDFYYSVGGLVLIKSSNADVHLTNADEIFHSVKAFSQSDGRWRYSSKNPESSAFAAGIALETLAGVVSLASSELDQSLVSTLNNDISKLFDSIEKYDDGALYFDDKLVDGHDHQGPLATTSSVVRGLNAFAALPGNKTLGLANFFLGIGVPGDAKDLFNQIDSLACLESNRQGFPLAFLMGSIPLIFSLPFTVISLTKKDSLQVKVNTVLGSNAPPLTVKLEGAFTSGSKDASLVESQELVFDAGTGLHNLNNLPKSIDVGSYTFVFEILLHEPEHEKVYVTGGQKKVPIFVSGLIKIENAEIVILDSDLGSIETQKKLDLAGQSDVSLSANHLQKLRVSFKLTTPCGLAFMPHQNFLGLVEKFFYLSGRYDIELTVGDVVMENSLFRAIGHIELDLPEPPEKASRPPPQPADPYSRYVPKAEITHIFRAPEKRPQKELSLAFMGLTFLPLLGFLFGLDLFQTLKLVGLLGVFLVFVGHRILSYLAATSAKLKSA
ncbi:hypothetical protein V6N11_077407 [Hibiscus sabdariffa]|uniref:Dolichyl-diphosphooligosaccharide--protein glycosyltransferase subunit 2 n=1 Tax=Hibiscus sabdariffa TaxID=183260 RepID=A0ABR2TD03_9ROSI